MKSVVITGSARGLGFELAKEFRKHGFSVALSDINEERLQASVTQLKAALGEGAVMGIVANVSKFEDMEVLFETAQKAFGKVDYWINNAGVNQPDKFISEMSAKDMEFVLNVDLKGAMFGTAVALKHMQEQGHGQIFNVEGMGSNNSIIPKLSVYGTSKHAVTYFTRAAAKECVATDSPVKIGRLSPGIMITEFLTNAGGDKEKIALSDKNKMVYNILGDYPDVIAQFLVRKMIDNDKNDVHFEWLTNGKAFRRFLSPKYKKRNFFN